MPERHRDVYGATQGQSSSAPTRRPQSQYPSPTPKTQRTSTNATGSYERHGPGYWLYYTPTNAPLWNSVYPALDAGLSHDLKVIHPHSSGPPCTRNTGWIARASTRKQRHPIAHESDASVGEGQARMGGTHMHNGQTHARRPQTWAPVPKEWSVSDPRPLRSKASVALWPGVGAKSEPSSASMAQQLAEVYFPMKPQFSLGLCHICSLMGPTPKLHEAHRL